MVRILVDITVQTNNIKIMDQSDTSEIVLVEVWKWKEEQSTIGPIYGIYSPPKNKNLNFYNRYQKENISDKRL